MTKNVINFLREILLLQKPGVKILNENPHKSTSSFIIRLTMIGLACLLIFSMTGCVHLGKQNKKIEFSPAVSIRFKNNYIAPPSTNDWFLQSHSSKEVTYLRHLSLGRDYSVVAFAEIVFPDNTFSSSAELLEYLKNKNLYGDSRYTPINNKLFINNDYGSECVVFKFTVEDRGVPWALGRPFLITGETLYKIDAGKITSLGFSRRYPLNGKKLDFSSELKTFFNSHRFIPPLQWNKKEIRYQGWAMKLNSEGEPEWILSDPEYAEIGGIAPLPEQRYIAVARDYVKNKFNGDIVSLILDNKGKKIYSNSQPLFYNPSRKWPYLSSGGEQYLVMAEVPDRYTNLLALDSRQNHRWEKRVSGPSGGRPYSIKAADDGGCLVAVASSDEGALLRYDAGGNLTWKRFLGQYGAIRKPTSISSYDEGWISAVSDRSFATTPFGVLTKGSKFKSSAFAVKIDDDGTILWKSDQFSFTNPFVCSGENGKFYFGGVFGIAGGRLWATRIVKMNESGKKIWTKVFKNFKAGMAERTDNGGCLLIGYFKFSSKSYFSTAPLTLLFLNANGNVEKWTVFTDLWGAHPLSIQAAQDGGYLITGR